MTPVQEQFERVKRWYSRFEDISLGRTHDKSSDFYQDDVYAFFQNCWHLKDWIIYSRALDKKTVDDFFNNNSNLKLCQAIAIGSKHLTISNPHVDSTVSIKNRAYSVSFNGDIPKIEVVYWVRSESGPPVNGFGLASSCIALCEGFLRKHNLIV